ncbi:MAG: Hsp20/alpha crystallin family protein [Gammaproteobacteria bacterium]|jgi:HSP20 family molecular chaperone IbpA|nr:Hsp20/alpha crystallin family protein [Gammaproteobacteria bacterium]
MVQKTNLKTAESRNLRARSEEEPSLIPPVDICEDAEGITLIADMPGVSRERLNIQIDGDNLLLDGAAAIDMPEGMEALFAEVRATHFRRSFTLSRELETEKINAQVKNGVLTLKIPKRAELKPRKIEVNVG